MKTKYNILLSFVFICCLILISCNKNKVYQSRHTFDNYRWERLTDKQILTFNNITINDTSSLYDIYVTIRHTPYINENEISFLLKITTPDGITRQSFHQIKLKDRYDDKWIGDIAGDLIDIEEKCRSFVTFANKGDYSISITNMGKYKETVGIIDLGIKVVKSNIDSYKKNAN